MFVALCQEKVKRHVFEEAYHMEAVKLDTGYISGTVLGDRNNQVHVYRGIPYAAPPTGEFRWKPPKPAAPWSGVWLMYITIS